MRASLTTGQYLNKNEKIDSQPVSIMGDEVPDTVRAITASRQNTSHSHQGERKSCLKP
jgi:hypothetical protein